MAKGFYFRSPKTHQRVHFIRPKNAHLIGQRLVKSHKINGYRVVFKKSGERNLVLYKSPKGGNLRGLASLG